MTKKRYPPSVIESVKRDRLSGLSIPQLVEKYSIPKTSVWHHVHNIKLPENVKKEILSRRGGSSKRRLNRIINAEAEATALLSGSGKELVMAVSMLYWAEGHKKSFVFTNTDVLMLRLYIKFLTELLGVSRDECRILIRTSDPIIPDLAILYWAKALDLPKSTFKVNHDNIQNRTKTKFGICRIMVVKSNYYHKIMLSVIKQTQSILLPL